MKLWNWRNWLAGAAIGLWAPCGAAGWEGITFDLPSGAKESLWRDALAELWKGATERRIEGGRIDVLTEEFAVEVDFPHKWHEGLGQSLHYSRATERQGVLAIIAYAQGEENLQANSRRRLELIESHCVANGIKMVVLFPSRPEEFARAGAAKDAAGEAGAE